MASDDITLYVLSTCPQCEALRGLLTSCGISFTTIEVDLLPDDERRRLMEEMRPHNPRKAFPVTIVNGKAIIGFHKDLILRELGIVP